VQEIISFCWEWLTEKDKRFKDYIIFPFSIIIALSLLLIIYSLFINAGFDDAIRAEGLQTHKFKFLAEALWFQV
jgi:hypothetical protein